MIKNSWKNTKPICECCGKELSLEPSRTGLKYKCPDCPNEITVDEFEAILDKLSKLEDEMYLAREIGVLTGKEFIVGKGIKCLVLSDDGNGSFTVTIKNPKKVY